METATKQKDESENELDELTDARRRIDATVRDLSEEEGVSIPKLMAALEASRDSLLVTGRVPDWWGDATSPHYREMVWGAY